MFIYIYSGSSPLKSISYNLYSSSGETQTETEKNMTGMKKNNESDEKDDDNDDLTGGDKGPIITPVKPIANFSK